MSRKPANTGAERHPRDPDTGSNFVLALISTLNSLALKCAGSLYMVGEPYLGVHHRTSTTKIVSENIFACVGCRLRQADRCAQFTFQNFRYRLPDKLLRTWVSVSVAVEERCV